MNRQPLDSLKGIGEKTGRLFAKLGIETVDELLEYYPRAYDACGTAEAHWRWHGTICPICTPP